MRGETEVVLCTAILDVVEAGFEEVCEHYEERVKNPDQPFSKTFLTPMALKCNFGWTGV